MRALLLLLLTAGCAHAQSWTIEPYEQDVSSMSNVAGLSLNNVFIASQTVERNLTIGGYAQVLQLTTNAPNKSGNLYFQVSSNGPIQIYAQNQAGTDEPLFIQNSITATDSDSTFAGSITVQSTASIQGLTLGTTYYLSPTAPPEGQALCTHNGKGGYCTSAVSSSGGCTCVNY